MRVEQTVELLHDGAGFERGRHDSVGAGNIGRGGLGDHHDDRSTLTEREREQRAELSLSHHGSDEAHHDGVRTLLDAPVERGVGVVDLIDPVSPRRERA